MNACVLHAIGDLRYEKVSLPPLMPGQVTLQIKAAGICGSDVPRVFTKGTYHFPTIIGHEFSGKIVAVADEDQQHLMGQRAAVFPLLPCFQCGACRVGEYAQCEDYNYYGSRCDGAFAEYLNVNLWNLVLLPEAVSYEEAAMCEPLAVAIHALSLGNLHFGDTVVISGTGTIGFMLAQLARSSGAKRIILLDIDDRKLEFARSLGFSHTINSATQPVLQQIHELTNGKLAQVVIEAAGAFSSLENCVQAAAPFGTVVLMGNPSGAMSLSQDAYWTILRRQLHIRGTWNSSFKSHSDDWEKALDAIARKAVDLSPLISHRFSLEECEEAFALAKNPAAFSVKIIFVPTSK